MKPNIDGESIQTYQARKKLKEIFRAQEFDIEEEVKFPDVTNNMGEEIWPPLRADMLLEKKFIIELDPESGKVGKAKGHGTKSRRNKDYWKDRNIWEQKHIKIVRIDPEDVMKENPELILRDIDYKLKYFHLQQQEPDVEDTEDIESD